MEEILLKYISTVEARTSVTKTHVIVMEKQRGHIFNSLSNQHVHSLRNKEQSSSKTVVNLKEQCKVVSLQIETNYEGTKVGVSIQAVRIEPKPYPEHPEPEQYIFYKPNLTELTYETALNPNHNYRFGCGLVRF